MSETVRMWVEVGFNITYLIVVWGLMIAMVLHREQVAPENRRAASLVIWAFALLALGDTGYVGFKVLAYNDLFRVKLAETSKAMGSSSA